MKYAVHPLAALIPEMSPDEYLHLTEDIRANGLRQPILLFEHMVLDGRHRLRACVQVGESPRFDEYAGDEPAAHVLSLNLHRRHLSTSQRAMIATDFLPHLEAEARQRQAHGSTAPGRPMERSGSEEPKRSEPGVLGDRSSNIAGQTVGVSGAVVRRAKRVAHEDPDLAQRVRDGDITVGAADTIIRERAERKPQPEAGAVTARSVQRIADQAASLEMAVGAIALTKSCARLTSDERVEALEKCKKGRKAINALVNALLAASEQE